MALDEHVRRLALGSHALITDLRLSIPAGAIHTLMGPSGSGKSSVLALVCGTLDPAFRCEESVLLDGQDISTWPTSRRRVGILFQDDLLYPHMSVAENLLFAVPPGPRHERMATVQQALGDLELDGLGGADPSTLSGGQRARVALMRALLAKPRALLLDEPFARLDTALRERMRRHVFDLIRARAVPTLLVTHDEADVADPQRVTRLAAA